MVSKKQVKEEIEKLDRLVADEYLKLSIINREIEDAGIGEYTDDYDIDVCAREANIASLEQSIATKEKFLEDNY